MWQKVIAGGPHRKTRLHDHHGNLVPLGRLFRNGPKAMLTTFNRVVLKRFIKTPWLSYDAQEILNKSIKPDWRVLEFGSGASTNWFADRAGFVLSHEDNAEWFNMVANIVGERTGVVRTLHADADHYTNIEPEYAEPFNLILVDGSQRDLCVERTLPFLATGGIMYLDNSDKHEGGDAGNVPRAKQLMLDYAAKNNKKISTIVDFAPSQSFVNEATLLFN